MRYLASVVAVSLFLPLFSTAVIASDQHATVNPPSSLDISGTWRVHFTPHYEFRGMDRANHEVPFNLVLTELSNGIVSGKGGWVFGLGPLDGGESAFATVTGQVYSNRQVSLTLRRPLGPGRTPEKVFELQGVLEADAIRGTVRPGNMTADKFNIKPPQSGGYSMNRSTN
jgi:hypothetical protein